MARDPAMQRLVQVVNFMPFRLFVHPQKTHKFDLQRISPSPDLRPRININSQRGQLVRYVKLAWIRLASLIGKCLIGSILNIDF